MSLKKKLQKRNTLNAKRSVFKLYSRKISQPQVHQYPANTDTFYSESYDTEDLGTLISMITENPSSVTAELLARVRVQTGRTTSSQNIELAKNREFIGALEAVISEFDMEKALQAIWIISNLCSEDGMAGEQVVSELEDYRFLPMFIDILKREEVSDAMLEVQKQVIFALAGYIPSSSVEAEDVADILKLEFSKLLGVHLRHAETFLFPVMYSAHLWIGENLLSYEDFEVAIWEFIKRADTYFAYFTKFKNHFIYFLELVETYTRRSDACITNFVRRSPLTFQALVDYFTKRPSRPNGYDAGQLWGFGVDLCPAIFPILRIIGNVVSGNITIDILTPELLETFRYYLEMRPKNSEESRQIKVLTEEIIMICANLSTDGREKCEILIEVGLMDRILEKSDSFRHLTTLYYFVSNLVFYVTSGVYQNILMKHIDLIIPLLCDGMKIKSEKHVVFCIESLNILVDNCDTFTLQRFSDVIYAAIAGRMLDESSLKTSRLIREQIHKLMDSLQARGIEKPESGDSSDQSFSF